MNAYKLVVVDPFEDYKRGDQITDQKLVNLICNGELHHYERHVRRVSINLDQLIQSISAEQNEANAPEETQPAVLHIETIKDEDNDFLG